MKTDYAVAPGEYVVEWMENNTVSKETMSRLTGYTIERLELLFSGVERFTTNVAETFSKITGIPSEQ